MQFYPRNPMALKKCNHLADLSYFQNPYNTMCNLVPFCWLYPGFQVWTIQFSCRPPIVHVLLCPLSWLRIFRGHAASHRPSIPSIFDCLTIRRYRNPVFCHLYIHHGKYGHLSNGRSPDLPCCWNAIRLRNSCHQATYILQVRKSYFHSSCLWTWSRHSICNSPSRAFYHKNSIHRTMSCLARSLAPSHAGDHLSRIQGIWLRFDGCRIHNRWPYHYSILLHRCPHRNEWTFLFLEPCGLSMFQSTKHHLAMIARHSRFSFH